ncbi:MAG: hypothetical protein D3917_16845, partial [Candidatus Electrothrix sp. AX5]|nr:hypothetical protein [Candidatus Electrothrix sp. AX5]
MLGASGTGKSSLVKAGLLPALENNSDRSEKEADAVQDFSWFILEKILRPGTNPAAALRSLLITELPGVRPERERGSTATGLLRQWHKKHSGQKLLLVIDQFEEFITLCQEEQEREDFIHELMDALEEHSEVLRVVLTLRSDFEVQISQNYLKDRWQKDNRFVVPPMTQDELREVIEQPASVMVLYFEPRELVDRLINEVIQTPGALPLLSFTLSELYRRYIERQNDVEQQDGNRALTEADYEAIGGVIGSLRRRIDNEYEQLPDTAHKETMKRLMLRMVAFEGGELTRRRVPIWEFEYPDAAENERVKIILDRLLQVRLIVGGKNEDSKGGTESYVEPAHDALVVAWDKLLKWRAEEAESMLLQRQLTRAAADWEGSSGEKEVKGLLWDNNPRLLRTQEILREKCSGITTVAKKSGLFRGMKQFWRVLFPSYKDLDQYIWLNQVETAFVRRSIERKRNWTRGVTAFISVVIVALVTAGGITWVQKLEADKQRENAVHQLAITYWNNGFNERKNGSPLNELHYFGRAEEEFTRNDNVQMQQNARFASAHIYRGKQLLLGFMAHKEEVRGAMFNKDETRILTWSLDGTARLWNGSTGQQLLAPLKHEQGVNGAVFNKDETRILTSSGDGTARLWDGSTGKALLTPLKHESSIIGAVFNKNETRILTWSYDGTVMLWDG